MATKPDCGIYPHNFGALPPLPDGYWVGWVECVEHFQAFGPGDWESGVTCDPYQARRWCFDKASRVTVQPIEPEPKGGK